MEAFYTRTLVLHALNHLTQIRTLFYVFVLVPSSLALRKAFSLSFEPPLFIRRHRLLLLYFCKISACPNNPVINLINYARTPEGHPETISTAVPSLKPLLGTINLAIRTPINSSNIAPWTIHLPFLDTSRYYKLGTHNAVLEQEYRKKLTFPSVWKNLVYRYAKKCGGVGCAVTDKNSIVATYRLPDTTSVYTAELICILKAMNTPNK